MKKKFLLNIIKTSMMLLFLLFLTSCSSSANKKSNTDNSNAKTVSFFASGDYEAGKDIQPGSYYAVLTKTELSDTDTEKPMVDVIFKEGSKYSDNGFSADTIGKVYKVDVLENTKIHFYSKGYKTWNITFFTKKDYEKYKTSEGEDDTNSSSSSSSSSSPSSSSSSSSSEQAIDITTDKLLTKLNKGELHDGEIYQFTGVPFEPDLWGMNADETHYTINVKAFDELNNRDNDLLLFTTKEVANKIKNSSNIKFKVKVSNAEDSGDLNVLSAIPS